MKDRYLLDLGDLVGNLFLILMEGNNDINEITYDQIEKFKNILDKEAENRKIKLSYCLSRDETDKFFWFNSDTFEEIEDSSIIIKEGVTPIQLIRDYKASLPLEVLSLVSSDEVEKEKSDEIYLEEVDYYINSLTELISYHLSDMEFEKCLELNDKLQSLLRVRGLLEPKEEEKSGKQKILSITGMESNN